jgi:hypothetical protein
MFVDMYKVANLILLCSLKHLLFETWKTLLQENMGYLIHLFFQTGIWVLIVLSISDTSPFFLNFFLFFMNYSCLSFYNWNFSRETISRTWSIYPNKHIFLSIPNVGVEHFWVDEKHVLAYSQCSNNRYKWSVHDLDLESMISFSTRVTRFDQTQNNDK